MKKRAYILFALMLCLFGASVYSAATVAGGAEYVAAAAGQSIYELDVAAARGVIYDSGLQPLVNAETKKVAAVAPTVEAVGAVETATKGKYRQRLAAALEEGKPFLLELEEGEADRLKKNVGIEVFEVPRRYGEEQPAAHVIGYLDGLGSGVSGVELAMNDVLESRSGSARVLYQVDALGRVMEGGKGQVSNTLNRAQGGVALTLDSRIQALAEEAGKELEKGAVVVTEVPGCEVRAMASFPDFSPLELGKAAASGDGALLNRALCAYAPGSVFKLVSAAALLESGILLEDYECTGAINAGGMLFHCYGGYAHGVVDLKGALEKSCNCYFINVGRSLGAQNILNGAYNMGLGQEQEFGRGLFSAAGNLPEAGELTNPRALANFSFGQGELTVTPLQMCGLVNVIASGGVYRTPKLILGTVDTDGLLTESRPVTDKEVRVIKTGAAAVLRNCMEGAVLEGTAKPGAPERCVAGVKTGTAQTGVFEKGEELLHFWYCGYISDENGPRYCVTVLCESTPDDKGATARVFRTVADGIAEMEFTGEE